MSIKDAYTDWSATYDSDRNLTRDLDRVVTRNTLANLRFKSILEIGCGTGKNTGLLAQIGDQVLALDFSEGMLGRARLKVQADHVTFAVADITKPWPCEDASADLIVCNLVLEHIENLVFIYSEAARCLTAQGRMFVCELHPFKQYGGTQARFERGEEAQPIQAFVHNLSDFVKAAQASGLRLQNLDEWWHPEDQEKPPRLVSFMFQKEREQAAAD